MILLNKNYLIILLNSDEEKYFDSLYLNFLKTIKLELTVGFCNNVKTPYTSEEIELFIFKNYYLFNKIDD